MPTPESPPVTATTPAKPVVADPAAKPAMAAATPEPVGTAATSNRKLANPAEPLAPTEPPKVTPASVFIGANPPFFPGYPKAKFHPVHGRVEVKDPNEEALLLPATDWFNTPELADASRTWTEAVMAQAHNTRAKLKVMDEAGYPIVRNSVAADEALRVGNPQPL